MDYSLLQFDALKNFLGVRLHGEGVSTQFKFFQCKPPNFLTKSKSSPLNFPGKFFLQHF